MFGRATITLGIGPHSSVSLVLGFLRMVRVRVSLVSLVSATSLHTNVSPSSK